jgi:enterochelin esterase-like enzyme
VVSALERFTIGSARSPERLVTVYAPDESALAPGRLPLLLLHDGQNLFDADRAHVPGQHWRVAETAEALITSGRLPPVVIAGIDHDQATVNSRRRRATGSSAADSRATDSFVWTINPDLAGVSGRIDV